MSEIIYDNSVTFFSKLIQRYYNCIQNIDPFDINILKLIHQIQNVSKEELI